MNNTINSLNNKIKPEKLSFYQIIVSAYLLSSFVLLSGIMLIFMIVIFILTLPFDRDRKVPSYLIKTVFYIFNFLIIPARKKDEINLNNIRAPKKGERRVYISNHASMYDIILLNVLPGAVKTLMKEAYAKIPVIGWIAVLAGNIIMREELSTCEQISMYMEMAEKLERGSTILIFPEGTRTRNSKIGRFYNGSFKIALDTKSDIVPIAIDSWNVIRPGSGMWIRDNKHVLKVLDPIKYDTIKDLNYKQLSKLIKIIILDNLLRLRDNRRKNPKYYRNLPKYIELDNEMREDLIKLKENNKELLKYYKWD
jgi:1-acyl-sn-glycerol-3-phosphate acyltransferase